MASLRRYSSASQSASPTPKRNDNSWSSTGRSAVSSLFSRTRRLGRRSSPPPPVASPTQNSRQLPSGYDSDSESDKLTPRLTSEYFKRYELMTEFINLKNPNHCPLGVYVMPSSDNINVWYGVIFVHKGYYRSGVFKFRMTIPESYPNNPPSVTFLTDMFHPLVDVQGNVSLSQRFPTWRPYQDYIFHVLHYLKNMFKRVVLDGLMDKHCNNKEAYRLYRTDANVFGKLAQQCAQLSITESYMFDHFPDNNLIRFSPLSDAKFDEIKAQIFSSVAGAPVSTTNNAEPSIEQQLKERLNEYAEESSSAQ
ncbi:hypothetical protein VTP01DRAFT_631 [Rhizomucor pusillus]|uniref:uncharacterized protein n=1 Tax=Rhizomucor pusillus TaxID=4840 RepID=UPI00374451CB